MKITIEVNNVETKGPYAVEKFVGCQGYEPYYVCGNAFRSVRHAAGTTVDSLMSPFDTDKPWLLRIVDQDRRTAANITVEQVAQ